jgi:hypothetical protein
VTPLLWADPPQELLRELRRQAASSVKWRGGPHRDIVERQTWQRLVGEEFERRLVEAGILVEGLNS